MEDLLDLCSAAVGQVAAVWSNVIECDPPSNIDGWVHVLRSAGSHIAPVLTQRLTPALEAARASRQSSSEIPVPQRKSSLTILSMHLSTVRVTVDSFVLKSYIIHIYHTLTVW